MIQRATDEENPGFEITPGQEGRVVDLNPDNTKDCGPLPA
jgi:hypothetical protein